jgi:hypothetical protein
VALSGDDRSETLGPRARIPTRRCMRSEAAGGLTVPVGGMGGSWIVKLPSARYSAVPENEFVMLELARRVGIAVPANRLVDSAQIKGLPEETHTGGGQSACRAAVRLGPRGRSRSHGGFRAGLRALSR